VNPAQRAGRRRCSTGHSFSLENFKRFLGVSERIVLQNFKGAASRVRYFIFDVLCYRGRDLLSLPLIERREYLERIPVGDRIKISAALEVPPETMITAIREQGLEGVVGKRRDSRYEPGKRSGAWVKMRVNQGQEFVIGGFIPGPHGLDSVVAGFYRGDDLVYVARIRNGFVPASRRAVFQRLRPLVMPECPFVNLPETRKARWGEALTAEKMKKCIWLRPQVVSGELPRMDRREPPEACEVRGIEGG
jgi:ATP-dependent DNA ligase